MIYSCKETLELLIDFVAGELEPQHRALLEKHLCDCPACHAYLETYQITIKLTRRLECRPLPPRLAQLLQAEVEAMRRQPQPGGDENSPRNC